MKPSLVTLLMFFLTIAVVFQSACSSAPARPDEEALTRQSGVPAFFHNIPADTPYLVTGMEPFPLSLVLPDNLEKYGPLLDSFFDRFADELQSGMQTEDRASRAVLALLEEFRGNFSVQGLEKLGFSMQPRVALYGIGPLPVFRMSLHDPAAFDAMLTRIENKAGIAVERHTQHDISYRLYRFGEVLLPVSIHGNELIVGITPAQSAEVYLPYMLGIKKPEQSLATHNQIQEIIQAYQVHPGLVGYMDLLAIFEMALEPEGLGAVQGEVFQTFLSAEEDLSQISEVCRQEMLSIFALMPRIVAGYEEFTLSKIQAVLALEFTSSFAERLDQTRTPIPGVHSQVHQDSMASLGIGIDLEKLVGLFGWLASEVQEKSFQCEAFAELNEGAAKFQVLSSMMPEFIMDIRGISLAIQSLTLGENIEVESLDDSLSLQAIGIVNSKNPTMLFQTLQYFVPFLAELELEENRITPMASAEYAELGHWLSPHLIKTATSLGFSVGTGMQDEMASLLEAMQPTTSPLLRVSYNFSKILQLLAANTRGQAEADEIFGDLEALASGMNNVVYNLDANEKAVFLRVSIDWEASNP